MRLPLLPVREGALVALKRQPGNELWRVNAIRKGAAICDRAVDGYPKQPETSPEFPVTDLEYSSLENIEMGGEGPTHVEHGLALQRLLSFFAFPAVRSSPPSPLLRDNRPGSKHPKTLSGFRKSRSR